MSALGRFLRLPTSGGAESWADDDQPLDSLWCAAQINNAEHLCEENNLRTLYEYPGLYEDLYGSLGSGTDVDTFPWDSVPGQGTGDTGSLVLYTGSVRLRKHGVSGRWPSVEWRWRWASGLDGGAPVTIGAVAVVTPGWRRPRRGDPYASTTLTSAAWTDGTVSVDLTGTFAPLEVPVAPVGGIASPGRPDESGRVQEVCCWLGFWSEYLTKTVCSSVAGVTCFLEAP